MRSKLDVIWDIKDGKVYCCPYGKDPKIKNSASCFGKCFVFDASEFFVEGYDLMNRELEACNTRDSTGNSEFWFVLDSEKRKRILEKSVYVLVSSLPLIYDSQLQIEGISPIYDRISVSRPLTASDLRQYLLDRQKQLDGTSEA